MKQHKQHIVKEILKKIILEQEDTGIDPAAEETTDSEDNENGIFDVDFFDEAEKKFLGSFDKAGSTHIGIIYSISDIGIREFIARSGKQYNCTPEVLHSLHTNGFIKIVPYGGWGRDDNYTIELRIPLDDVAGFKDLAAPEDPNAAAAAPPGGSTPPPPPPPPPPGPENAGVIRYGKLLKESSKLLKTMILNEKKS